MPDVHSFLQLGHVADHPIGQSVITNALLDELPDAHVNGDCHLLILTQKELFPRRGFPGFVSIRYPHNSISLEDATTAKLRFRMPCNLTVMETPNLHCYPLLMSSVVALQSQSTTFAVEIAVGGLLFDMDGVLVSSPAGDERCWTRWASRHLPGASFDLRQAHGRRAVDTIRIHFPALDHAAIQTHIAELDAFAEEEQCEIVAYSGAHELLARLPPYRWTVVTSATEKMMRRRLSTAGVSAPLQVVAGDMVGHGKPDPECYLKGAALLSRSPEECLVIEDAPAGIRAANAAGCRVLAVVTSHCAEELQQADWIVSSLDQIAVRIDENATLNLTFPALVR